MQALCNILQSFAKPSHSWPPAPWISPLPLLFRPCWYSGPHAPVSTWCSAKLPRGFRAQRGLWLTQELGLTQRVRLSPSVAWQRAGVRTQPTSTLWPLRTRQVTAQPAVTVWAPCVPQPAALSCQGISSCMRRVALVSGHTGNQLEQSALSFTSLLSFCTSAAQALWAGWR